MTPLKLSASAAPVSPLRIVLVHGAGHDAGVWDAQLDALRSAGFAVMAPDLPGHGGSPSPALSDIASMATWLIERLHEEHWGVTAIVGHSMGSLIALEACARAPELFHSLILVGTAFPMPVAPTLLQAARDDPDKAHALINKWSFAPPVGETDTSGPLHAANLALMRRQRPGVLANDLAACDEYRGGLEAAAGLACRRTLICGALDRMTPAKSSARLLEALAGDADDVAMITFDGAGHLMMSEEPAALTRAISEYSQPRPELAFGDA